ncbi:MAG: helix-turn-helix transcriptional regulator [Chloroflexi bacterium]|nr:helix-turn-helix transcriptional regulator [Chloroflexota bacterium]
MIVKTKIFELNNSGYNSLSEMAQAMGISVSQIYRVRGGKRRINHKFIVGAIKAFPNHKFDDLFYLAPDMSSVNHYRARNSVINVIGTSTFRGKRMPPGAGLSPQ